MISATPSEEELLNLITLTLTLLSQSQDVPAELSDRFMNAIREAKQLAEGQRIDNHHFMPDAVSLAFEMQRVPELAELVQQIKDVSAIDRNSADRLLSKLGNVSLSYG